MTAMIEFRCKMANVRHEENATNHEELNFKTQTTDGILLEIQLSKKNVSK